MMRLPTKLLTLLIGISLGILLIIVPSLSQSKLTETSPLIINGIGDVRVGMNLKQAETAAGTKLIVTDEPNRYCFYVKPQGRPEGIGFMMVDYKIARVDIFDNPRMATLSGAKIGDTEDRIKSIYPGQIQVTPHKYDNNGHYLTFVPKDRQYRQYRLVFETDGKKVTRFRSGKLPEVEFVEGCA